jgi:hypothetical protein
MSLIEGIEGEDPGSDEVDPPKLEAPLGSLLGKHKRGFARDLANNILAGMSATAAKSDAAGKNFPVVTQRARLKKANALLEKFPAVNKVLQDMFAQAGLPMERLTALQVELVEHPDPDVKQRALNKVWDLTVPRPTQKLQVQSLGVVEMITRQGNAPKIATRIVDGEES